MLLLPKTCHQTVFFTLCTCALVQLYTPHSSLFYLTFTLHTIYSTLCTLQATLYTLQPSTLYTQHFTLDTVRFRLHTLNSTLHSQESRLHILRAIFPTQHTPLYPHSTLGTIYCTVYSGTVSGRIYKAVEKLVSYKCFT